MPELMASQPSKTTFCTLLLSSMIGLSIAPAASAAGVDHSPLTLKFLDYDWTLNEQRGLFSGR